MNFKNDYERLAYYEAKMNYYGSKLNDADGGGMFSQSSADKKKAEAEKAAIAKAKQQAEDDYKKINTQSLRDLISSHQSKADAHAKAKIAFDKAQSAFVKAQLAFDKARAELDKASTDKLETNTTLGIAFTDLDAFNKQNPTLSNSIKERDRLAQNVKDLGGTV